jgi:hypothetical protein
MPSHGICPGICFEILALILRSRLLMPTIKVAMIGYQSSGWAGTCIEIPAELANSSFSIIFSQHQHSYALKS